MAKRKSDTEGMGAHARHALQFADRLAERDQIAFGILVGYAIKKLADLEPESLSVMLVGALTKLAEYDRPTYDGLGGQIIWNTLKDSGFLEALAELKQKLAAHDTQGATEVLERIGAWVKGIERLAEGGPVQALIDAQEAGSKAGKTFVM